MMKMKCVWEEFTNKPRQQETNYSSQGAFHQHPSSICLCKTGIHIIRNPSKIISYLHSDLRPVYQSGSSESFCPRPPLDPDCPQSCPDSKSPCLTREKRGQRWSSYQALKTVHESFSDIRNRKHDALMLNLHRIIKSSIINTKRFFSHKPCVFL